MKRNITISVSCLLALFFVSSPNYGQKVDLLQENIKMKEGHHAPKVDDSKSSGNYKAYLRSKAWNPATRSSSLFNSIAEIEIPTIGGRVRSTLVDATNNIYLAAPSGGGLWTFNKDDGSPFTPVDDLGSFMPITTIEQDPSNPLTIYVATGDELHNTIGNGVFKSTDGGKTFSQIASTDPQTDNRFQYVRSMRVSPESSSTLYLSSGTILYKSTNSGATWTEVYNSRVVWQDYNRVIREIAFTAGNGVLLAVDRRGIVKSTSGNAGTFSLLTTGIESNATTTNTFEGVSVATHGSNRDIAYALFIDDGSSQAVPGYSKIYKTTDGGNTWTQKTDALGYHSQSWFVTTIGVSYSDPNIVVVGNVGWSHSSDGGTTWLDGCGLEVDFHSVHFHPSQPKIAYIGYDQGIGRVDFDDYAQIWCSGQSGWTQESRPSQTELGKAGGFNTTQIYYGDYFPESYGDDIIMGQQDGGSFSTAGSGGRRITVGDGAYSFINKQDPTKGFSSTQNGNMVYSTDATNNTGYSDWGAWGPVNGNHPNWVTNYCGNDADGNQLYVASKTDIHRTIDGLNFTTLMSHGDLQNVITACSADLIPTVYAIGVNSSDSKFNIIKIDNANTANSGTTYSNLIDYNTAGTPYRVTVDPNDKYTIYITTSRGKAYKVSELNNPSPVVTNIEGNITDVQFNDVIGVKNDNDVLIAGTNIGVFYSLDDGTTWTLSNDFPHTKVNHLRLRSSDSRLFVFTYGRGAWAANIVKGNSVSRNKIRSNNQVSLYPNPTTNMVTIKTDFDGEYGVKIFNQLGKLVLEQNSTLGATKTINVTSLSAGTYITHIVSEKGLMSTKKLVIK